MDETTVRLTYAGGKKLRDTQARGWQPTAQDDAKEMLSFYVFLPSDKEFVVPPIIALGAHSYFTREVRKQIHEAWAPTGALILQRGNENGHWYTRLRPPRTTKNEAFISQRLPLTTPCAGHTERKKTKTKPQQD